jgi:hypothetical protein
MFIIKSSPILQFHKTRLAGSNEPPKSQVSLLKSSGLLKVLGPVKYGGGGQTWDVGYKVIREVAKGDG